MEEKFLESYDQLGGAIFRYVYFKTGDRETALDLTQDVFTRAWEYLSSGRQVENMKAFLYRSAHNAVVDYFKKHKTASLDAMREETGFDAPDRLEPTPGLAVEIEKMRETINLLDEDYREVTVMRYLNDMTVGEIAQALGERENTVSVRLFRAIEKLKKMYGEI